MPLFVALFTDKKDHGHVREAALQAHIEWLEQNKDVIPVGGSLRSEPDQTPRGGMWIARAASKEALDLLIRSDPFYAAGLRESYEILYWSKASAGRMELI